MPTQDNYVIARSRLFDMYQILRTFYSELTECYLGHIVEMRQTLAANHPEHSPSELTNTALNYLDIIDNALQENSRYQFVISRKNKDCPEQLRFPLLTDEQLQDLTSYSSYSMQNYRAGKIIRYLIKGISPHVPHTSLLSCFSVFHPIKHLLYIDAQTLLELQEVLQACQHTNALKIHAHERQELFLSVANTLRLKHRQKRINHLIHYLETIMVPQEEEKNDICIII